MCLQNLQSPLMVPCQTSSQRGSCMGPYGAHHASANRLAPRELDVPLAWAHMELSMLIFVSKMCHQSLIGPWFRTSSSLDMHGPIWSSPPLQIHKHPSELSVPLAWAHVELSMLVCQVSVWHSAWLRSATSQDIILSGFSMGPYGAHHASANRLKANVRCCTSGTGPSVAHYAYIIDSFSFIQRKCKNPEVKTSSALLSSMGPYGAHHASANILSSKCTGCTSSMGSCGALHASLTIFTVIRGPLAAIVSSLIAWAHMELTMLL